MILSKEFLTASLTEKELRDADVINKWTDFFSGTHNGTFYASGHIGLIIDKNSEFLNKVKPYVSEEDYKELMAMVERHGNKEFQITISLRDANNIMIKAGLIKEGRASMVEKRNGFLESFDEEELKDSLENGIGLNILDIEEKDKDGNPIFETEEAYDRYVEMFIINNVQDEESLKELGKDLYEQENGYVSCIWDLFNHFLKNDGTGEEVIKTFEQAEELTGNQVEVATDVYTSYLESLEVKDVVNESLIIESSMGKNRINDSEKEVLEMLKSHGYNYLVRNSKGILMAYGDEPVKSRNEDWHANMSMPYKVSQQYMFKFIKPNNRRPCKIDNLLQSEDLQVNTMQESVEESAEIPEEVIKALKTKYGIGAIDLFPDILYDLYPEIMEEEYSDFHSEEFDVFASYFPADDGMYWELFVKSHTMKDHKPWGDAISTELLKRYMVNDSDVEIVNKVLSADQELIRKIIDREITEMTQASAVGAKVDYPQRKKNRKRRGGK